MDTDGNTSVTRCPHVGSRDVRSSEAACLHGEGSEDDGGPLERTIGDNCVPGMKLISLGSSQKFT